MKKVVGLNFLLMLMLSCGSSVALSFGVSFINNVGPYAIEATLQGESSGRAYDAWMAVKYHIDEDLLPNLQSGGATSQDILDWVSELNSLSGLGDPQLQLVQSVISDLIFVGVKVLKDTNVLTDDVNKALLKVFGAVSSAIDRGVANYIPKVTSDPSHSQESPLERTISVEWKSLE